MKMPKFAIHPNRKYYDELEVFKKGLNLLF